MVYITDENSCASTIVPTICELEATTRSQCSGIDLVKIWSDKYPTTDDVPHTTCSIARFLAFQLRKNG